MKPYWTRMAILAMALTLASGMGMAKEKDKDKAPEAKPAAEGSFYTGGAPAAEAIGWHIGCQAYSFNKFTFFEAVDKTASMGLHTIEAYPGQALSKEHPEVQVGHDMPKEYYAVVQDKLKQADITLRCYGVVGLSADEAANRKVFDFAKAMGIETVVSEPPMDALDLVDKLANEYGINVAFHNHPKPSKYYDYKAVLEACKGRSKRLGSCADTGHWMRSGINPVEAIKALEGRIISLHFKDLNEASKDGHDVPWGTGKADIRAILTELHRQGFKGVFSAEYEHNWMNSVPEIAEGVKFLNEVAAELSKK